MDLMALVDPHGGSSDRVSAGRVKLIMLRVLGLCTLVLLTAPALAAAETAEIQVLGREISIDLPKTPAAPRSWEDLEERNKTEGKPIAARLASEADALKLDAYGRLMLVRTLAMTPRIDTRAKPRTLTQAADGSWDERSRAQFVATQVQLMGYPAFVFSAGERWLVGLPTNDPDLNARTQSVSVERKTLLKSEKASFTFVLWDVQGRIGDPLVPPGAEIKLVDDLSVIFDARGGKRFDFRKRAVPESLRANKRSGVFRWPGGKAVGYDVFPDVAAYLRFFPEHTFAVQAAIDADEVRRTGLGKLLAGFHTGDEARFVSEMLQAVQLNFKYTLGPLRSAPEVFDDLQGDCDQLSLVLARLLVDAGYAPDAIAAVTWDTADHLGLAVRPRKAPPAGQGFKYVIHGKDYYVLDTTYYHRREDELITAWGEMNPENRTRSASLVTLYGK